MNMIPQENYGFLLTKLKPSHCLGLVQASFEEISEDIRQWGAPRTCPLAPWDPSERCPQQNPLVALSRWNRAWD